MSLTDHHLNPDEQRFKVLDRRVDVDSQLVTQVERAGLQRLARLLPPNTSRNDPVRPGNFLWGGQWNPEERRVRRGSSAHSAKGCGGDPGRRAELIELGAEGRSPLRPGLKRREECAA